MWQTLRSPEFLFPSVLSLPLLQLVTEKTDAIHMKELERDMFAVQDQLLRLQAKRKDQQQEKAEGEAKRQQVHEGLEVAKNMHSMMADKLRKENAYGESIFYWHDFWCASPVPDPQMYSLI